METFQTSPGQSIQLQRLPLRKQETLQAWDNADAYLVSHCHEQGLLKAAPRILIVNDAFGALAVSLAAYQPVSWGDSLLSRQSLEHNLQLNNRQDAEVSFVPAHAMPKGPFDLVLLKVPKSLAFWEETLKRLQSLITSETTVISGGMIKHTPRRVYELLETHIGPTRTSLGWKKARLAFSEFDMKGHAAGPVLRAGYEIDEMALKMIDWPNLFSYGHLDIGTRLLLENLPETQQTLAIADLGCGNGILALAAAKRCPKAEVLGVDESFQAVACARENADRNGFEESGRVQFSVMDGLSEVAHERFDCVLCNPPFHQVQVIGDALAWRMFQQARRALKPGGELRIVGNRHLGYHIKLRRLFGHSEVIASNSKFVVLRAVKK